MRQKMWKNWSQINLVFPLSKNGVGVTHPGAFLVDSSCLIYFINTQIFIIENQFNFENFKMSLKVVSLLSFCALTVFSGGLGVRSKHHHYRHEVELPSEYDQVSLKLSFELKINLWFKSDLESDLHNREDFEGDDNTLESRGIPNPFKKYLERFDSSLIKVSSIDY